MNPTVFDFGGNYLYNVPPGGAADLHGARCVTSENCVPQLHTREIEAFRRKASEVFAKEALASGLALLAFDGTPLYDFIESCGDRTLVVYLDSWFLLRPEVVKRMQLELLSERPLWRILFTVPDISHRQDMVLVYPDCVRVGRDDGLAPWQARLQEACARQNAVLANTQHAKRAELRRAVDAAVGRGMHRSPPAGVEVLVVSPRPAMADGHWRVWLASRVDVMRTFEYDDSAARSGGYVLLPDASLGPLRLSLGRSRKSDCYIAEMLVDESRSDLSLTYTNADRIQERLEVSRLNG